MDLTPKKGKEYSIYELMYMSRYAHALCESLVKASDTPINIRVIAKQICDYTDNMVGAMIYLRPKELNDWCERFKAYTEQLNALIQQSTQ